MMLGFVSFILLMAMAVLMPNLAQICGYMDKKLSTGSSTVSLLKSFNFGDAADLYSDCMSDGNGDIITQLNDNFTDPFNSIVTISQKTLQFNDLIPSFSTDALQNPFDLGAAVIDNVNISAVLDVQDSIALDFFNALASKSYTKDPIDCTGTTNINADSWTPSF